jgi:hypothetical protein
MVMLHRRTKRRKLDLSPPLLSIPHNAFSFQGRFLSLDGNDRWLSLFLFLNLVSVAHRIDGYNDEIGLVYDQTCIA